MEKLGQYELGKVHCVDCLDGMAGLPENSIDTIITDPPYGLKFMSKKWDHGIPGVPYWSEALRVAKPGSMLMAFGGTRTFHRLVCAIEDAGWEIRDTIMWVYGSGFPKSYDISKAIDREAGVDRKILGPLRSPSSTARTETMGRPRTSGSGFQKNPMLTSPSTEEANEWNGYGTALKPAYEPICLAMKPLDGTFANNALKWDVSGLWIDGGRIGVGKGGLRDGEKTASKRYTDHGVTNFAPIPGPRGGDSKGRFPANLIHDGSDEVIEKFPSTKGGTAVGGLNRRSSKLANCYGSYIGERTEGDVCYGDEGSVSRFFYCAKASRSERDAGLSSHKDAVLSRSNQAISDEGRGNTVEAEKGAFNKARIVKNNHPTVKPVDLIRYLCRLTRTPSGGVVLDPFSGSGTTGLAAMDEDRRFIGFEISPDYCQIANGRLAGWERRSDIAKQGIDEPGRKQANLFEIEDQNNEKELKE